MPSKPLCLFYQCPANSFSVSTDGCTNSFAECRCVAGFEKKNGASVKKYPSFQCPMNSSAVSTDGCIDSFAECKCVAGFEKKNGACVKKDVETILCYVRNLDTQNEDLITESFSYTPGSRGRYSIRCDTTETYAHSKWDFN